MRGLVIISPKNRLYRCLSGLIVSLLSFSLIFSPTASYAQSINLLNLPVPGTMIAPSPAFVPVLLKGMTIHPEDPLKFDFIIDSGNTNFSPDKIKSESERLVKYFLAALTVPEKELWVNLSPYEQGRIISDEFGKTEMGRDLLGQDYILKQLSASLMYPEKKLGQEFWQRVYKKAQNMYGTTNIPVNTFNKVWIVPDKAVVYEHERSAFVVDSHLKVMLEGDYQTLQNNVSNKDFGTDRLAQADVQKISDVSSEVVRQVLIPEIEKEVNQGKNFANLRQIYNSMILATWFKLNFQESLLGQVYANKNKTKGIELEDKAQKEQIYQQYLEAFKKGVYNYIKEDVDQTSGEKIPRKYFSGGMSAKELPLIVKRDIINDGDVKNSSPVREVVQNGLKPSSPTTELSKVEVNLVENAGDGKAFEQGVSSPVLGDLRIRWHLVKLTMNDPQIRIDGLKKLGDIGDMRVVPILEAVWSSDRDVNVRTAAAEARDNIVLNKKRTKKDRLPPFPIPENIGEKVKAQDGTRAQMFLFLAVQGTEDNPEMIRAAVSEGASVNQTTTYNETALMQAAEQGHENQVRELINNNADPNLTDVSGNTVLDLVIKRGMDISKKEAIIKLLKDAGAKQSKDLDESHAVSIELANQFISLVNRVNLTDFSRFAEHAEATNLLDSILKSEDAFVVEALQLIRDRLKTQAFEYRDWISWINREIDAKKKSSSPVQIPDTTPFFALLGAVYEKGISIHNGQIVDMSFVDNLHRLWRELQIFVNNNIVLSIAALVAFGVTLELIFYLGQKIYDFYGDNISGYVSDMRKSFLNTSFFPNSIFWNIYRLKHYANTRFAKENLIKIGKPAIPAIVKLWKKKMGLGHETVDISRAIRFGHETVDILRAIDGNKPMMTMLSHEDRDVRTAARSTLKRWRANKDQLVTGNIDALLSKNSYARKEAAQELRELGDKRAVEPLIAMLGDKDENVRVATIEALEDLGDQRAVEPIFVLIQREPTLQLIKAYINLTTSKETVIKRVYMKLCKRLPANRIAGVFKEVLKMALDGYDFTVVFEPKETRTLRAGEGHSEILTTSRASEWEEVWVWDVEPVYRTIPETLQIIRGKKLDWNSNDVELTSSPVQNPTENRDQQQTPGGIDLNPALLDLQIKRDENGVPLPLPQQPIQHMKIDGFFPVIINVTPIPSLPALIGMTDEKEMKLSELKK